MMFNDNEAQIAEFSLDIGMKINEHSVHEYEICVVYVHEYSELLKRLITGIHHLRYIRGSSNLTFIAAAIGESYDNCTTVTGQGVIQIIIVRK